MIAFCVDASPHVGMGHLVRCRVLAEALSARGIPAAMYGPSLSYRSEADRSLFAAWEPRAEWHGPAGDGRSFAAFAKRHGAIHAVIDDYRANADFQSELSAAGLDWLQQFDASQPQRFLGRLVVNASPFERAEHYREVASHPDVRFLLGPRYAILRREFDAIEPRRPESRTGRVFMSFGGGDDQGSAVGLLNIFRPVAPEGTRFLLVSGAANPRNPAIAAHIAENGWTDVELLVNPGHISDLMRGSDLAVLGGGTTTYEAARCGLPMLLVAIADNQIRQSIGWQDLGAAEYLGRWGLLEPGKAASAFRALMNDRSRAEAMARGNAQLVDCVGTQRLINMLLRGSEQ